MKKIIITFLAILSGVCFGVAVSTHLLTTGALFKNYRAYIVQSGSMAPALPVGSVVFTQSATEYSEGDIITFSVNSSLITHRIVEVNEDSYNTKGDANEDPDSTPVPKDKVVGHSILTVPYLGYLANFVRTPKGFVMLVVIPASIIVYEELKNILKIALSSFPRLPAQAGRRESIQGKFIQKDSGMTKVSALIPVIGVAFLFLSQTGSFFGDTETSTTNILGAAEEFGTPEPTPPPDITGLVVINEVYYDPDSEHMQGNPDENDFEWVEIFNNSTETINLKDWSLQDNTSTDSISHSDRNLGPGEKVVLAKADNVRVIWGISQEQFIAIGNNIGNGLANTGDKLILKDSEGKIVDQISYGTNIDILNPSITDVVEGHSIERSPAGTDTDTAADFVDNIAPSPGT